MRNLVDFQMADNQYIEKMSKKRVCERIEMAARLLYNHAAVW